MFGLIAASCSGDAKDGTPCCARDESLVSGCVHLGGKNQRGCFETCDFWCSFNWRVERDEAGCEVWEYDVRQPAPGENSMCVPGRDER
jgi:hypothetical protein